MPSPDGLYDVANPIDAFFHVGASPIAQVFICIFAFIVVIDYFPVIQIFITIGALESINHEGKLGMTDMHKDSTREVGQFSLPFYGASQLKGKSEALVNELKLKELKNGRLAMLGKIFTMKSMQNFAIKIILYSFNCSYWWPCSPNHCYWIRHFGSFPQL